MKLESLGAVHTHTHTHTPSLYKIIKKEEYNKITKGVLCQNVDRHK